ncbi:MAG: hypothetical protein KDA61_02535, partial [Planctomycetales bacterium]|nr:hypothetical protein [Planctomycetales bacterium]
MDRDSDLDGTGLPAGGSVTVRFGSGHSITSTITTTDISLDGSVWDNRAIGSLSFAAPSVSVSRDPASGIGFDDAPTETLSYSTSGSSSRTARLTAPSGATVGTLTAPSGSLGISSGTATTFGLGTYSLSVTAANQFGDLTTRSTTMQIQDDDTSGPTISLGGNSGPDSIHNFLSWAISDASGLSSTDVTIERLSPAPAVLLAGPAGPSGTFDLNAQIPGVYLISANATDADTDRGVGDRSSSSLTRTITITDDDVVPPTISLGGSSGVQSHVAPQSFNWNISDASGIGQRSIEIRKDGGLILTTSALSGSFDLDGYGLGTFQIVASATDLDNDRPGDSLASSLVRQVVVVNSPPAPNAGGPYVIAEGSDLTLAGAATDADGEPLDFSWDLNNDGIFGDATGAAPTVSWSTLAALSPAVDDDGNYAVSLRVTDAFTSRVADTSLTIENVAPTLVDVSATSSIRENGVAELTFQISDPNPVDSFLAQVDWGDASPLETIPIPAGSATFTTTHQYLDDGASPGNGTSFDVSTIRVVSLTDDDGGAASLASSQLVTTTLTGDVGTTSFNNALSSVFGPIRANSVTFGTLGYAHSHSGTAVDVFVDVHDADAGVWNEVFATNLLGQLSFDGLTIEFPSTNVDA